MLKHLIAAIALACLTLSATAQEIGSWQVYPSYWIATQNLTVGSYVYGLMNGSLLRYDTEDTSITTYDCLRQLSDTHIAFIAYSSEAKKLILLYENGNIDLMDTDDNVWNISSLKDASMSDKTVNGVVINGATAYILTAFGFLTVDMDEMVIRDTYEIDLNVKGLLPSEGITYVCTSSRVYACSDEDNWHISSNWVRNSNVALDEVTYTAQEYNLAGGLYWHSDGLEGLRGYRLLDDGTYELATGSIQPNSPVRDLAYRMQYVGDRLLVAGGINTDYSVYYDATAMYFEDGLWTNFDETLPAELYPNINHRNTTNLVQDPLDDTHHFASPYRSGLYEYRDTKFVQLYNYENSPIQVISSYTGSKRQNYNCAVALKFDADANLWMANQNTDTIIRILTPSGQWKALYYSEIATCPTCDDFIFTASGVNFLNCRRSNNHGFFGFTTNGTLDSTADDQHVLRRNIINEDGTSYTPDQFYCMAEDLEGQVWCGTNLGLFVIEDPTRYFDNDFTFQQIKIPRNDGSGLADYLLSGVPIRCIAVDYANRKWIGTDNNGVYLVSSDGQEMLQHFQAADSPLLSDNINYIAVHPSTGLVMIGTDEGLCSYMADALTPEAELDKSNIKVYPNPVSPDYHGPITVDGLTMDSEVKVCSSTGQLIWSGRSNGGRFTWNGTNKQGRRVASGVYNIVANNAEGKKAVVARVIVIK